MVYLVDVCTGSLGLYKKVQENQIKRTGKNSEHLLPRESPGSGLLHAGSWSGSGAISEWMGS